MTSGDMIVVELDETSSEEDFEENTALAEDSTRLIFGRDCGYSAGSTLSMETDHDESTSSDESSTALADAQSVLRLC